MPSRLFLHSEIQTRADMRKPLTTSLPRHFPRPVPDQARETPAAPLLLEAAALAAPEVYTRFNSSPAGLTDAEAAVRRAKYGPNVVGQEQGFGRLRLLGHALINPLVILLLILATISFLTGDERSGIVMLVMVVLGVLLRFVQEARADAAAARLKAMIHVTATVIREGQAREIPLAELVPGDVVKLACGDMIPADLRLVTCKDLYVTQASLTGESFPVEKSDTPNGGPGPAPARQSPLEMKNLCFLGTSVETGSAHGVIVATGSSTYLGAMAGTIMQAPPETSFDRGIRRFTWLMIQFIIVMVPLVFLINGITKHDWKEAFFFAVAVAVGLTPEMLPLIVSVCLSKGAILLSRRRVIVKRLNAIQNLGAMDVLCTDKTGTLTMDRIILEKYCDVVLRESEEILILAYLNSYFQTGLKNVMDRAILKHCEELEKKLNIPEYEKVDEIPFDFSRKVMSVVVRLPDGRHRLICKGAPEEVMRRCTSYELEGEVHAMEPMLIADLREEYDELGADGFRVLGLAYRDMEPRSTFAQSDERDLVLMGYVAFLDPPRDSAQPAIRALQDHGVTVKVLTGDNELVSQKICREVGITFDHFLLGRDIEGMSDCDLEEAAHKTALFCRLSPTHKQRIIQSLQRRGHVVGFLGDGINDAPALRTADVGISVDSAVDIARESADAILLEKSLQVMSDGVVEGRKVFVNILKYIRMGASSNFGNMFSVLGASIFLPFVPMAPIQILTNNLLYDFSQVPIPTDEVDPEQVARPRPWSMSQISRFILLIGPCSSVFDYTTFLIMLYVFDCWDVSRAPLFQTGWFVESLLTQTLIIHIIRTNRIPFLQSQASWPLMVTTVLIMAIGASLPFLPLGAALGLTPLPGRYWPLLAVTLVCYMVLTQAVKGWLLRRKWL
jgi:Mg2+-importing ATPase